MTFRIIINKKIEYVVNQPDSKKAYEEAVKLYKKEHTDPIKTIRISEQ